MISYNKLWKLLIDKNMNKKELREKSGISTTSMAKLLCLPKDEKGCSYSSRKRELNETFSYLVD